MLLPLLFFVIISVADITAQEVTATLPPRTFPTTTLPPKCLRPNETYQTCASCEKTCENFYLNLPCDKKCRIGCFCREGYVRNKKGVCVSPIDCPIKEMKCPKKNEEVYDCVNFCNPPTCSNQFYKPGPPKMCPLLCKRGCACKCGYVIDDIYGQGCIPIKKCPPRRNCCANEEFLFCGPSTPVTCDNRNVSYPSKGCVAGCFCIDGYVEDRNGNCIPEEQCPLNCQANEIEVACPNPCQPTCAEPHPYVCKFLVCNRDCICLPPYVRDLKTGECVDRKTCQGQCKDINAVYNPCGSVCIRTCENYKTPILCKDKCRPGCYCKDGYVFDKKRGKCIPPEFCNCKYSIIPI